jgi:ubiquinone/menaquinone biosynthesis C-methylase UbiE
MSTQDRRVVEEFSRQASAMSDAAIFNDETILNRIRDFACPSKDTRVLDVACGPGIVVAHLAPHCAEITGCDLTPAMLDKARERCAAKGISNARFTPGRVEALPFADETFDVVVSRSAVHHFTDPPAAFREMSRVVRKGGRVITVDVAASEIEADARLHNALEILRDPSHVRMLSKSELHLAITQAGLVVEDAVAWTNYREFDEWMTIIDAPERSGPLKVVMTALADAGVDAGVGLRIDQGKLRFEHQPALTVAVKW